MSSGGTCIYSAHMVYFINFSMGITWNVFDNIECITFGYMALYVNEQHNLYIPLG